MIRFQRLFFVVVVIFVVHSVCSRTPPSTKELFWNDIRLLHVFWCGVNMSAILLLLITIGCSFSSEGEYSGITIISVIDVSWPVCVLIIVVSHRCLPPAAKHITPQRCILRQPPPLRGVYTLRALVTLGAQCTFIIFIIVFWRRRRDVEGRGKYKREDPMVMRWQKRRRDVPTRSGRLKSGVRDTKQ